MSARPASPRKGSLHLQPAPSAQPQAIAVPQGTSSPSGRHSASGGTPSSVPRPLTTSPAICLMQQMGQCTPEEFSVCCTSLVEHIKRLTEAEAPVLSDALVNAMRMYFGHDHFVNRCWPLANLLDEFCASRECMRNLALEDTKCLLRELMRSLNSNSWTRHPDLGENLLRKLNLCCVMLLQNLSKQRAFFLLLVLGTEESEVVGSILAVKCIKKLAKNITASKNMDQDVQTTLEETHRWLSRAHPRLRSGDGGTVEGATATVMEGARALAEVAYRASPSTASAFLQRLEVDADPTQQYFQEWFVAPDSSGKENASANSSFQHDVGKPLKDLPARSESPSGRRRQSLPSTLKNNNQRV